MSTVASRTFVSSPQRDTTETWKAIIELLTKGETNQARVELESITGIASSIISDQTLLTSPMIVTCDGPRTRIYCVYGDDAVDGSDANEEKLGFDPLKGDWKISLPCLKEDLEWIQKALKKHTSKITARDMATGLDITENDTSAVNEFTVDLKGFLGK